MSGDAATASAAEVVYDAASVVSGDGVIAADPDVQLTAAGGLVEVDRDEIPPNYRLLVNAPMLKTFKYVSAPHRASVTVKPYDRDDLIEQVRQLAGMGG